MIITGEETTENVNLSLIAKATLDLAGDVQ